MSQTLALFHDAYRELNAKRMFWVVLVLSGICVLGFAAIGVSPDQHFTILGKPTQMPALLEKGKIYKLIFSVFGVQIWLAWVATILAIISTASIFPDLITGGSIDLYLCKPISRLRLFLTKYAAGMTFVALQVLVFCVACFVVIGLRGESWEPRIFLAVPLVVCVFSYLWCVSVLLGVLTRSTLVAMLLTIVFGVMVYIVDKADEALLSAHTHARRVVESDQPRVAAFERQAKAERKSLAATQPTADELRHADRLDDRVRAMQATLDADSRILHETTKWQNRIYRLKKMLPKVRETNDVLSTSLLSKDDLFELDASQERPPNAPAWLQPEIVAESHETMRARPLSWTIGTSLIFEAVILSWAAWVFCRRDY